jgi:prepilin-type N-terminal cleavage/methylation domain-containing protein
MVVALARPLCRRAFTLVEMLAAVAVLVIVLGLMVSLARHVRERSAQALTKSLLRQLNDAMADYVAGHGNAPPAVTAFPPAAMTGLAPDATTDLPKDTRAELAKAAEANNRDLVNTFRAVAGPVGRAAATASLPEKLLSELPPSVYDNAVLRDAWGSPVLFLPTNHPWIGMAPRERPYFFVSAGPDRDYLTRGDNLYSYEETPAPAGASR